MAAVAAVLVSPHAAVVAAVAPAAVVEAAVADAAAAVQLDHFEAVTDQMLGSTSAVHSASP